MSRNEPGAFDAADFPFTISEEEITSAVAAAKTRAGELVKDKGQIRALAGYIDLTTLAGDDTPERVHKLYARAAAEGCAAVCVYPARVADVAAARGPSGTGKPAIASVAGGFPSGQFHLASRRLEVALAVEDGAEEIDIVIPRALALTGDWKALLADVSALRGAVGAAHLKTILAVGELQCKANVYMASVASLYAGSDFIKTSTGKEAVNANLPDSYVMLRAVKDFYDKTGVKVGFKPAGGIRKAEEALAFVALTEAVVGKEWLSPTLFRIGASSLLDDVLKASA